MIQNSIPTGTISTSSATILRTPMRYFFVSMACLFPVLVSLGFVPSYMMAYSGAMHLHWFAHVHGIIMTSWLLLFLTQSILVAKRNFQFHRKLGMLAVAIGILVWLSMIIASVRARLEYYIPVADDSWDILLVELYASSLFALFFTWGIMARKNAAAHKRMLLLSTIILMTAAIDRILPHMLARFVFLDLLLVPLIVYDLVTLKQVHKITAIGAGSLIVIQLIVSIAWGTPTWHRFASSLWRPFVTPPVEVSLKDSEIAPLLGDYGDAKWHMSIVYIDSKIYLQMPGIAKKELGASSETELFVRTMPWKINFTKDTNGRVVKIINTQPRKTWEVTRYRDVTTP